MKEYITKKLIYSVPVIFGVIFLVFMLVRLVPGDPVQTLVGKNASQSTIQEYKQIYGLDKPIYIQFFKYIKMVLSGNCGYSYYTKEPVWNLFIKKLPNTLLLTVTAICIAILCGIFAGVIASIFSGSKLDNIIIFLATSGISIPIFWWGLILMIIFSYFLKIFPPTGTGMYPFIVLPAVTLATRSIAYITMITRASMLETAKKPFVLLEKALGIKYTKQIKNIFRNALVPIITIIALDFGSYMSGAVLTETVFGWDGVGKWVVDAIFRRDYPVILIVVLWSTIIFIFVNLVSDILCCYANPKIRYKQE